MKPFSSLFIIALMSIVIGCANGGTTDTDADNTADSLRADSIARLKADSLACAIADSLRADSLLQDSLRADSILEANALRFTDFFKSGSATITYLSETDLINHLKAKGFEITQTKKMESSFDPSDPEGTNFPMRTNYYMANGADSLRTTSTLSILFSEYSSPITINFGSDRERDIFVNSLKENGFSKDETGNLAHRSNKPHHGVNATESGRRVVLEHSWTY